MSAITKEHDMTTETKHTAGDVSDTPLTDMIENEALADYRYCEKSFNYMAEHARDLEIDRNKARAERNALLSVNADLLAALEACANWFADRFDGYPESTASIAAKPAREKLRAALARAKGES